MRESHVRQLWDQGQAALCGWCVIGNSVNAEIVGSSGVDAALVDLQHGMISVADMVTMLQALSHTPATPFVRVPNAEPGIIMKALDAGAFGVICPLVNTADDARCFVDATRYPPLGNRSFGPVRGVLYGGEDYAAHADNVLIRLAMIETLEGLDNLEAICAVDGLDGVFIGPSDLSLALGVEVSLDPTEPTVVAAIARIRDVAKAHDKKVGMFCASGAVARRMAKQGFDFLVPNAEANLLGAAIRHECNAFRGV